MKHEVHYTSAKTKTGSDVWETPKHVFDWAQNQWGPYVLDACANQDNTKCAGFYTAEQDSLKQPWVGNVWCNPPYSELLKWVKKAICETEMVCGATVTMLIPARTDTKAFKLIWQRAAEIVFITGRIKFVGAPSSAPFPSMLVHFDPNKRDGTVPKVSLVTLPQK